MYINTFFGRSVGFSNGFHIGFNWVHCNGITSKTSAVIAGYHPPSSITWLWALYWSKPAGWKPSAGKLFRGAYVRLPMLGALELRWQSSMPRKTANADVTGLAPAKEVNHE
jgi:hypothetical protein